jgi:hypothetical protein
MGSRVNRSGSFCQDLQNEFVGGKAAESLESFGADVGSDEVAEVNAQSVMAVVVVEGQRKARPSTGILFGDVRLYR